MKTMVRNIFTKSLNLQILLFLPWQFKTYALSMFILRIFDSEIMMVFVCLFGFFFQQLKYCCWPYYGTSTTHQRWILSCGANVGPKTCLPTIVELSSLTSIMMQKLFNSLLGEVSFVLQ